MKSTVLWDDIPYSLVVVYQNFGGMYCLHLQGQRVSQTSNQQEGSRKLGSLFDPEDGDSMFLRNVSELLLATCYHIPEDRTLHSQNLRSSA
jgi:hypothetical protein